MAQTCNSGHFLLDIIDETRAGVIRGLELTMEKKRRLRETRIRATAETLFEAIFQLLFLFKDLIGEQGSFASASNLKFIGQGCVWCFFFFVQISRLS